MTNHDAEPVTIAPEHMVVLIRVSRDFPTVRSADDLYEVTRKWWVMDHRKHEPEYAFSVYKGIVQAVYRIDSHRWQRRESDGRWAFNGDVDAAMEARYVGKDVSGYFTRGAQNPIKYVNC